MNGEVLPPGVILRNWIPFMSIDTIRRLKTGPHMSFCSTGCRPFANYHFVSDVFIICCSLGWNFDHDAEFTSRHHLVDIIVILIELLLLV